MLGTRKALLFATICLTGCASSELVIPPYTESKYGPENEGVGTIRYVIDGGSNREHAMKTMHEECRGQYQILQETTASEVTGYVPVGSMLVAANKNEVTIRFKCVQQ